LAESKLALDLDPFSASIKTSAAWPLLWGRRTDEAVDRLSAAVELHPSYWTAHYYLGLAHQRRGDSDCAIGALEKARSLSDSSWGADALAYVYAMAGRRADAEAVLQRLRDLASSEYVSPYSYAVIEAGLGERDRAFESLHAAIDDRSWRMAYLDVDLFFDVLRADPRFAELSNRRQARPSVVE
jgi:tetratricopeptide (TPR) repeat protein